MRFRKVYINSSFRKSGTSTRFHYELPQDIDCSEGICHCAITSVCLPNSMYSVQSSVNDKLYIYISKTHNGELERQFSCYNFCG